MPRTPEMEDLGIIRKTKHVAFLDSVISGIDWFYQLLKIINRR